MTTGTTNTLIGRQAGYLITTGSDNTVIGAYNGNGDGLDIRTSSNNIVLSDGAGNARAYYHGSNENWTLRGGVNNSFVQIVECSSSGANPHGLRIKYTEASPDNHNGAAIRFQDGGNTTRFQVLNDGDVQNHDNSYGSVSDQKLKEQIADASSQWDDIKDLQIRKYKMKEDVANADADSDSLFRLGVIAQELETAGMSGLVTEQTDFDDDGNDLGTVTKGVKYSILYMKAVKALQEAMERIETLESKVAALEAE